MCVKLARHNCIMQSLPGTRFVDLSNHIPVGLQEGTILQSGKEVLQLTCLSHYGWSRFVGKILDTPTSFLWLSARLNPSTYSSINFH